MKLSKLNKDQWKSVVINALLAGVATFVATLQTVGTNKAGATAGLSAALMAVVKVIQKAFSE